MISRALFLFCFLLGCTERETTVRPHEMQKEVKSEFALQDIEDCNTLLSSKAIDNKLCEMGERTLTPEETRWAFDQLSLSAFINDPEINKSIFTQRLIWNISSHILNEKDQLLINKVVDFVITDCNARDLKSCRTFNVFSSVNNTRDLFIRYLENKNNKKNLETVFILATHASNRASDERLLAALGTRHNDFVYDNRIVLILKSALATDLDESIKSKLQLYISRNEKRLEHLTKKEEIAEMILEMQSSLQQMSTRSQLESLKKTRPALFESLKSVGKSEPLLAAVYDLVFAQVVTEKEASQILNKLASEQEIVETFKIYVQNRMLVELDSNDRLVKRTAEEINLSSIEFLNRFIENIDPIRLNWNTFKSKVETLSAWISGAKLSLNAKVEMKNFAKGLDSTVKIYAEYPHMFYLAYLLSKKNFALIFASEVDNFNIEASDIFAEIINPKKTRFTWLGYTDNQFISSQFAIMSSLTYMLSSQSLDVLGVNGEQFLSYLVKNFNKKYIDIPSQKIESIDTFFQSSTPVAEFKNFCTRLQNNEKTTLRVQFDDLTQGFLTQAFDEKIFQMISLSGVEVSGTGGGYAPFGLKDIPDLHEYSNTDIEYVLDVYAVIQRALKKVGQSSAVIDEAIRSTRRLQVAAKASFKEWIDYGFCLSRVFLEEKKILQFIMAKEIEYLKGVYNDVKSLALVSGPRETDAILGKYKTSYLLGSLQNLNLKPLDQISSKGYLYSRFDMIGRVAHYLEKYSEKYAFEIILPNQIEKAPVYKYSGKSQVNSNWRYFDSKLSFEDWTDDFYRHQMGSFTGWSNRFKNTVEYTAHIANLVSLLKTSDIVTTQNFLDEYKIFTNYLTLGELEKKMLLALKKESLWDLINLNQYFLNIRYRYTMDAKSQDVVVSDDASKETRDRIRVRYISSVYGLYDFVLLYINEDVLGLDYWVKRQRLIEADCEQHCTDYESNRKYRMGPLAQAENFFKTLDDIEIKALIYPLDQQMVKLKYVELKSKVLLHEKKIDVFISEVHKNYDPNQRVDVSTKLSITGPVISQPAMNQVTSQKFNFHLKTQSCFKAKADCY